MAGPVHAAGSALAAVTIGAPAVRAAATIKWLAAEVADAFDAARLTATDMRVRAGNNSRLVCCAHQIPRESIASKKAQIIVPTSAAIAIPLADLICAS